MFPFKIKIIISYPDEHRMNLNHQNLSYQNLSLNQNLKCQNQMNLNLNRRCQNQMNLNLKFRNLKCQNRSYVRILKCPCCCLYHLVPGWFDVG